MEQTVKTTVICPHCTKEVGIKVNHAMLIGLNKEK